MGLFWQKIGKKNFFLQNFEKFFSKKIGFKKVLERVIWLGGPISSCFPQKKNLKDTKNRKKFFSISAIKFF